MRGLYELKRTGEKYKNILDAAVRVICKYGYHDTQVSKIAREARVADGTIYLYFKNKDDVLISLFREKMGAFISTAEEILQQYESSADQLKQLITLHFRHLENDPQLAIVTQIELRQSHPEVREGIRAILKKYIEIIERIVARGVVQGIFRSDIEIRMTRKMIFGFLDEMVTSWIRNQHKYSLLSQVDEMMNLIICGIGKNEDQREEKG